jgi:hypothetical protein
MYRSPGPAQCQGGTYAHVLVIDQDHFYEQLAAGWHATLPDALAPQAEAPIKRAKAQKEVAE